MIKEHFHSVIVYSEYDAYMCHVCEKYCIITYTVSVVSVLFFFYNSGQSVGFKNKRSWVWFIALVKCKSFGQALHYALLWAIKLYMM